MEAKTLLDDLEKEELTRLYRWAHYLNYVDQMKKKRDDQDFELKVAELEAKIRNLEAKIRGNG